MVIIGILIGLCALLLFFCAFQEWSQFGKTSDYHQLKLYGWLALGLAFVVGWLH